jgi:exopolysaccharide biosynthesis polyprenyl glycosylphosphotransferase
MARRALAENTALRTNARSAAEAARSTDAQSAALAETEALEERLLAGLDQCTLEIIERRRRTARPKSRGWLLRRLLLVADLVGLSVSFLLAVLIAGGIEGNGSVSAWIEYGLFLASLPLWVVAAKVFGLYDKDESRTDHSTLDDLNRVLLLVTTGAFFLGILTGYAHANVTKVLLFWIFGVLLVAIGRVAVRVFSRRTLAYVQNAVIVGAGEVGQLAARKLLQHPEYGINLVGLVDSEPKERRSDLRHLTVLGRAEELPDIVRILGIERVIIAFSRDAPEETMRLIRSLRGSWVQVDIVPRLFDIVGPNAVVHTLEGMPLLGLPPGRIRPSSLLLKRAMDIVGASIALVVSAPLFVFIALRIWLHSGTPIFFRQTRLGLNMREFTVLKFRTMRIDADDGAHREYIKATMEDRVEPGSNGLFKLDPAGAVTDVGRWLRKTSLDELPQLINVLRGDMSLVGPRPCLQYEVEHFAQHHFERFLVPAGLTGLWQITARAHSKFGEALDMDVVYVRSWSLGLDLRLLLRTPLQLLRRTATT